MEENVDNTRILYFGYGSNLDNEDWTKWCLDRGKNPNGLKEVGPAWLDEYQLCFDYYSSTRECGAANLQRIASGMAATPGALFEIDEYTLDLLDRKEGVNIPDCYQRISVTVYTSNGQAHEAITYIHYPSEDNFYNPSEEYEALIRNGLERLNLSTEWLDFAINREYFPRFDHVFVYGTLMKGMSRHYELEDGCEFVSEGTVNGELYQISDYPGIIVGNETVYGELYKASDMFQVIQRLDWVENAGGNNQLFTRVIQKVETNEGSFWAYTYHYARELDSTKKIQSGRWI